MLLAVDRTVVSTSERQQKWNCYFYMVQHKCCWLLIVLWCPRLSDNRNRIAIFIWYSTIAVGCWSYRGVHGWATTEIKLLFLYGTARMLLAVDRTVVSTAERQQKTNCNFLYGIVKMMLAVDRTVVSTAERQQKNNFYVVYDTAKMLLYNTCVLPATTYGAETWSLTQQAQNKLAVAAHTKMVSIIPNIIYKDSKTKIWVRDHLQWEKNEVVLGRSHQPPQWTSRVIMWSHKTRKDDKEDQPSGGETTWTNTGSTWSGRGHHNHTLTRRWHAEAFAHPREHYGCPMINNCYFAYSKHAVGGTVLSTAERQQVD